MRLREIYSKLENCPKVSFEVFPPKETTDYSTLITELENLKKFNPSFISLTYGAGGKNNNSPELIKLISQNGFSVMPHFTCICSTKEFVFDHIKSLENSGIENILALRGDVPDDKSLCCNDFKFANELVNFIKSNSNLSVGVAGYPEGHIEAKDLKTDILNLKKKIDAGAECIFTQLFFDNNRFFSYLEQVRRSGIDVPVVAGIMPILSKNQINRMTKLANITIPKELNEKIEKYQHNPKDLQKFGIEFGIKQCSELVQSQVSGLHFFTLNKSESSYKILENIL